MPTIALGYQHESQNTMASNVVVIAIVLREKAVVEAVKRSDRQRDSVVVCLRRTVDNFLTKVLYSQPNYTHACMYAFQYMCM